jgi:hypothetical protein
MERLVRPGNSSLLWTYPENKLTIERWGVMSRWNLGDEIRRLFSRSNLSRYYVVATGHFSALHKGLVDLSVFTITKTTQTPEDA